MIFCRNSIYLCSHHHLALCYYARCTAKKQGVIENFWFFTLFCGIKIITYKIGIEKEHYLLQNVSCLKLRTEVE